MTIHTVRFVKSMKRTKATARAYALKTARHEKWSKPRVLSVEAHGDRWEVVVAAE